jgi:hypothetical protein
MFASKNLDYIGRNFESGQVQLKHEKIDELF